MNLYNLNIILICQVQLLLTSLVFETSFHFKKFLHCNYKPQNDISTILAFQLYRILVSYTFNPETISLVKFLIEFQPERDIRFSEKLARNEVAGMGGLSCAKILKRQGALISGVLPFCTCDISSITSRLIKKKKREKKISYLTCRVCTENFVEKKKRKGNWQEDNERINVMIMLFVSFFFFFITIRFATSTDFIEKSIKEKK